MNRWRAGWSGWRLVARTVAFLAAYLALMLFSYRVARSFGEISTTVWWPAAGLALGVFVRAPRRVWWRLGVALAAMMVLLGFLGIPAERTPSLALAGILAAVDVLAPLLGAWLLLRWGGRPFALVRVREVVAFVLLGVFVPAALPLCLFLLVPLPRDGFDALLLAAAQAAGVAAFAPVILTWPHQRRTWHRPSAKRIAEGAALVLSIVVLAAIVYRSSNLGVQAIAGAAATFPLLAWAAVRFGPRGAALCAAALSLLTAVATAAGYGPFASLPENQAIRVAYDTGFFAVAAVPALLLAAITAERRRAECRERLSLEAGEILARSEPLGTRLQLLAERAAALVFARCEIRLDDLRAAAPAERVEGGGSVVLPVEGGRGVITLQVPAEVGRLDPEDLEGGTVLADRIAAAEETERLERNLERHLAASEESLALLDAVMRSAPIGISIHDTELRFLRVNEKMASFNRISVEGHLGKHLDEVLPGIGLELQGLMRQVLETGDPIVNREFETEHPAEPGVRLWFLCTWFPVGPPDRPLGVCAFVIDITEAKRQEAEVRRSAERFRLVAEVSSQILWTASPEGVPREGAEAWSAFTGQSIEDYRSLRWIEAVHPDDRARAQEAWLHSMESGDTWYAPYRLWHRSGTWRHVIDHGVPVHRKDGSIREWVGMVEDVTERVAAEAERAEAWAEAQEAIRVRDDFLSIASHELKTPLTPLAVRLQRMQRGVAAGQPVERETIEKARGALERLSFLVNDLLDVARIRAARLTTAHVPLPLREVVAEVADAWSGRSARHRFVVELPNNPVWIAGERSRIAQVVENLVDNAVKYSPAGGRIGISLRVEEGEAKLSISDEGIGIPPEDIPPLFDRFFRAQNASARSYGGLGLGLYITRDVVEHHGGRIEVESEVGRGSTFRVSLPLLPPGELEARLH